VTENTPNQLGNVISIDDERIKAHLDRVVRGTVEEMLNSLLNAEPDRLCNAGRYERSEARRDTRAGHYERNLQTKAGAVPAPANRGHGMVKQEIVEHRAAERPADERCHHGLSQCRAPLSPNQKCEKLWTCETHIVALASRFTRPERKRAMAAIGAAMYQTHSRAAITMEGGSLRAVARAG
jgi:hypothetical protein